MRGLVFWGAPLAALHSGDMLGTLKTCQTDLELLRRRAAAVLGEPVRLFHLGYDLENFLLRKARKQGAQGLNAEPAIQVFDSGANGHLVRCGLQHYELLIEDVSVPVVNVINPFSSGRGELLNDFWAVAARHYRRVYRFLRRGVREKNETVVAPIMPSDLQERLWDNTVGFLQRGEEALRRFGVALKRGVLLTGEPGNGKTLAARWLYTRAVALGLEWITVTAEHYEAARNHGNASMLFQLDRPGVILFDDFDMAIRNRDHIGPGVDSSTFLAEMDGINLHSGVVYLFTSNARLEELDPAFRRPGRIDQIIHFARPDAALRRRLVEERWPAEMLEHVPLDELVTSSAGCTFAEIDEIKKLLVLNFLQTERWDWPAAWKSFAERGATPQSERPLGFAACKTRHNPHRIAAAT